MSITRKFELPPYQLYPRLMRGFIAMLFLLITYTCYSQSNKTELYAVFGGGLDESTGTLMPGSAHQRYRYFLDPVSVSAPEIYAGLQVHLLGRFQFTAKFGFTGAGSGIRYRDASPGFGQGGARTGSWIAGRRKKVNYDNGLVTSTWRRPYMRIAATAAYNFYRLRFEKGLFNHFGIDFNAGLGIDYSFLPKSGHIDSLKDFHPLSLGNIEMKGLEKQNRYGAGGLLAGLNAQIVYRGRKRVEFGVWYHYIPHPNMGYLINLSYEGAKDRFKLYGGKHQFLFFVEIPVRIGNIRLVNKMLNNG